MGACLGRICGTVPPPRRSSDGRLVPLESVAPASQLIDFAALERTASQVLSRIVEHAEGQAAGPDVDIERPAVPKRASVSRATDVRPISRPVSRQISQPPSPTSSPPPPPRATSATLPLRRSSGLSSIFRRSSRDGQDPWLAHDIDTLAVGDVPTRSASASSRGREVSLGGYEEELDLVHLDDAYLENERDRTSRRVDADARASGLDMMRFGDILSVLASQVFTIRGREYTFSIASAPRKCNTSGSVTMTPPLIARLRVSDESGNGMAVLEDTLPYLVAQATVPERASPPASLTSSKSRQSYTRRRNGSESSTDEPETQHAEVRGVRTASAQVYHDQNDEQGVFFVFPGLQIVTEGSWRLAVSLVALWPPELAGEEVDMSQSLTSLGTGNSNGGGSNGRGSDNDVTAGGVHPPIEAAVLATVTSPHAVRTLPESWPLGAVPQGLDRDTQMLLATLRRQGAPISGSPSMLSMLDNVAAALDFSPSASRTTNSDTSMRSQTPDQLSSPTPMEPIQETETPLSPESMSSL